MTVPNPFGAVYVVGQSGTSQTLEPAADGSMPVSAGSAVINVQNLHASAALNGTIKIDFVVVN